MAFVGAALIVIGTAGVSAQDRPVRVIVPESSPVRLDEGLVFTNTGVVVVPVRNRSQAPVLVTVGVWVFGERGELKGTSSFCSGESLGRGMRRGVAFSLELPGLGTRDAVVATVTHMASARARWDLGQSPADQAQAAWTRAQGGGGRLSLLEIPTDRSASLSCPFACEAIGRACEDACRDGVKAFTCTTLRSAPWSAACSCR